MKTCVLKYATPLLLITYLTGCSTSTTTYTNQIETFSKGNCTIQVFYSKTLADEAGATQEVCRVEGSSAFSFDHSLRGAIKNNLKALCECGVDMAYLSNHHTVSDMGFKGITHVNLVGFKFKN